jgi:hypothetical protein
VRRYSLPDAPPAGFEAGHAAYRAQPRFEVESVPAETQPHYGIWSQEGVVEGCKATGGHLQEGSVNRPLATLNCAGRAQ